MRSEIPLRYFVVLFIPLITLLCLPVLVWKIDAISQQTQRDFRKTKLEHAKWQRYHGLLATAPIKQLTQSSDRTSLEISLREAAQALQLKPDIQIDAFLVKSADVIEVDDELGSEIKPIRIGIEATIDHAPALLSILSLLDAEAGWRVSEVRGCALQRLASEPKLAAACSIDIYHWSWTTSKNRDV